MKYTAVVREKMVRKKFKTASLITLFLMFLPIIFFYRPAAQDDTFWLINTGKYILLNGFPVFDPFTIHERLTYPVQQWLSEVIFYKMYSVGGFFFIYITVLACYLYITIMLFKLTMLLSERNLTLSFITTTLCNVFLGAFITARPQAFSYAIFVTLIYILESAIQYKDKRYLIGIPILSILLINLNAALWVFFFLLIIPYMIDGINIRKTKVYDFIKHHARLFMPMGYGVALFAFFMAVGLLCGYFNPYRLGNMIYTFKSYSNPVIHELVGEMQSPDFKTPAGIAIFALYVSLIFVYLVVKGKTKLRYLLLTLGTAYLGVSSIRNIPIFVICSVPFLAFYVKDVIPERLFGIGKQYENRNTIVTFLATLLACFMFFNNDYNIEKQGKYAPVEAAAYIHGNVDTSSLRLFNEYETGGYLEYKGIKTFIDTRAEVFTKELNGREDIISDYNKLFKGEINYRQVFDKYRLNHALVRNYDFIDNQLKYDSSFEIIHKDDIFTLYRIKSVEEEEIKEVLPPAQ